MKKYILGLLLPLFMYAESINLNIYGFSYHEDRTKNEKHDLLGISYRFYEVENYFLEAELTRFNNSFGDDTKVLGMSYTYTPIYYEDGKAGLQLVGGYQKGYCSSSLSTHECEEGESDQGFLAMYSFYAEYKKMYLTYTFVPGDSYVHLAKLGFKVHEW